MGELVILKEWKRNKEEEEIESLRKELEELMSYIGKVDPAPYFSPVEFDSSFFHTSISGVDGFSYSYDYEKNDK